ncbi:protein MpUGT5 [Marchantia polymorpha subsp. ruderalis]|nr:hypothetical protein MARPO_0109s0001 [Marchantia polymorpha]BBN02612.1 hypothetical protein Mp_2g16630 [Marchantia polymorpha subsp. ruderalis]|eukprot:PTQ31566.1 hypothetical protein MARPO_0109s0001 [Marchantia polymorpha]
MGVDSSTEGPKSLKKHVLLLAVSLHAHIAGMVKLAVELAQRGVTVTYVGEEMDLPKFRNEQAKGLDLRLISFDEFPSSKQILSSPNFDMFDFVMNAKEIFQPVLDIFMRDKQAGKPGPTCIIADRLLATPLEAARLLGIPHYMFYSCGANFARMLQMFPPLFADGTLTSCPALCKPRATIPGRPINSLSKFDGAVEIDGFPPLRFSDMFEALFGVEAVIGMGEVVQQTDALIMNTFYEFEAPIIEAIQRYRIANRPWKPVKVFCVGPISSPAVGKEPTLEPSLSLWLDSQAPESVIYMCFGSIAGKYVDPEQAREISQALEDSGHPFLWAFDFRPTPEYPSLQDLLPPGFEERMKGRGIVQCGWVPQLELLSHSSIGAFITHSGWNSVLEAVCVGVPMIAWPRLPNDQGIITRHIVDFLKIAVEVGADKYDCEPVYIEGRVVVPRQNKIVGHAELGRAIRLIMSEEGSACRSRLQELKRVADAAAADGGARSKAFGDLVELIPGTASL